MKNAFVTERFIVTYICQKYMTSISKNKYVDKLDNIVNAYNNIYHRTIKMEPSDVNPGTQMNFDE